MAKSSRVRTNIRPKLIVNLHVSETQEAATLEESQLSLETQTRCNHRVPIILVNFSSFFFSFFFFFFRQFVLLSSFQETPGVSLERIEEKTVAQQSTRLGDRF